MNIGIITFHHTTNFGATLQTIAMGIAIERIGHNCEIINYDNENIDRRENPYFTYRMGGLKNNFDYIVRRPKMIKKYNNLYNTLKQYLKITEVIEKGGLRDIASKYDVIITGSDMLWNPNYTNFDKAFFLDLEEKKEIGSLLLDFSHIAVREKQLAGQVEEIVETNVDVVCDPTMLLDSCDWEDFCTSRKIYNGKYILIYMYIIKEKNN